MYFLFFLFLPPLYFDDKVTIYELRFSTLFANKIYETYLLYCRNTFYFSDKILEMIKESTRDTPSRVDFIEKALW